MKKSLYFFYINSRKQANKQIYTILQDTLST